jgi:carbonic anhydrase
LVARNVCGHVGPALSSILALDSVLTLSEVMVVHHTDCGALLFTDDTVKAGLKARAPENQEIDGLSFGAITDVPKSVQEDLAILKASPLVRKELAEKISGFVFDIKTGLLTPVEA